MNVQIEIIPHSQHRYPTVGDWFFKGQCPHCKEELQNGDALASGNCPHCQKPLPPDYDEQSLIIRVSKLSDWRREMLVAVHELVEVILCKHRGISQEATDTFDKAFEAKRTPDNEDEPGDEPGAPYVVEHCTATGIERLLAAELGVYWKEYEQELSELP